MTVSFIEWNSMLTSADLPDMLSGKDGPLVSVLLATHQPEETIRESIQSVADQTYAGIELVIINGSNDEWLETLGKEVSWIKYASQTGTGIANAWNEGINMSSGKYLSFLADDDYYEKTKTEKQVKILESTGADVVYSDEYVITPDSDRVVVSGLSVSSPEGHYKEYFRQGQGVPHLTVTGRTSCFEQHRFDESLAAREDPHLWVRIFRDCTPAYIGAPLAYKRRRQESLTGDPERMYQSEIQEINDLVERFEELKSHEAERKRWAKYRYGRNLLDSGRTGDARKAFVEVLREDPSNLRACALLIAVALPVKSRTVVELFETIAYHVRNLRNKTKGLASV